METQEELEAQIQEPHERLDDLKWRIDAVDKRLDDKIDTLRDKLNKWR